MEGQKRVAAIHDLSCFGRCSLAVVLPVLSAMGAQCCPLPTAVLSTHTGGFDGIARTDLTGQMEGTLRQWEALGLAFDGVYTGYMASAGQIALAAEALSRLKKAGGVAVADPVLGDHGRLYRSVTPAMAAAMKDLCGRADVITPNLTEAALLLGGELPEDGEAAARALSQNGGRSVVITGVSPGPGLVGAAWFDRESGRSGVIAGARAEGEWPGTGDLFASALTGGLVRGEPLEDSVGRSVDFVRACAERTAALGTPPREGVAFEPLLEGLAKPGRFCYTGQEQIARGVYHGRACTHISADIRTPGAGCGPGGGVRL